MIPLHYVIRPAVVFRCVRAVDMHKMDAPDRGPEVEAQVFELKTGCHGPASATAAGSGRRRPVRAVLAAGTHVAMRWAKCGQRPADHPLTMFIWTEIA